MEVVYACCGGLDVHAKTAVACRVTQGRKEMRTFATMTDELLQLGDWFTSHNLRKNRCVFRCCTASMGSFSLREREFNATNSLSCDWWDWLRSAGCTHVAIESPGGYWKPVFNMLESLLTVILVNARPIKAVPGRKTDVRDCAWLADLLRQGLLKASCIPPPEIRELREVVRYRQTLVTEHTAVANRMTKLIESANIKLGHVASEVLELRGRLMRRALAAGETNAETLAELAQGKVFLLTQVRQPLPRKHTVDAADEILSIRSNQAQKHVRRRRQIFVHELGALLSENADVHGLRMEIDAAILCMLLGIEIHPGFLLGAMALS